jgi:hypothetical protein
MPWSEFSVSPLTRVAIFPQIQLSLKNEYYKFVVFFQTQAEISSNLLIYQLALISNNFTILVLLVVSNVITVIFIVYWFFVGRNKPIEEKNIVYANEL